MKGRACLAAAAMLGLLALVGGCQRAGQAQPMQSPAAGRGREAKMGWAVSSTAFKEGERIPRKYTCDGEDVSPQLSWSPPPPKTVELALICDDPDAPRGRFVHWVLYGLPASIGSLPEAAPTTEMLPQLGGAKQGKNSAGRLGYTGPCPPAGPAHHYHFILYALEAKIALKPAATEKEVRAAMEGHVLGQAELVGLYSR